MYKIAEKIINLSCGYWSSAAFFSFLKLGLIDILRVPKTIDEILNNSKFEDKNLLEVFLTLLEEWEFVEKKDNKYQLTSQIKDLINSEKNILEASFYTDRMYSIWQELPHTLITGKPVVAYPHLQETSFIEKFAVAMHKRAHLFAEILLEKIELPVKGIVIDIGGGTGGYTQAFARKYKDTKFVVVDLPQIVKIGRSLVKDNNVRFVGANYYNLPFHSEVDAILVLGVLHQERYEEVKNLIENCLSLLKRNSKIFIMDFFRIKGEAFPLLFYLNMRLINPLSTLYRPEDIVGLLQKKCKAKVWKMEKLLPYTIIEGEKI